MDTLLLATENRGKQKELLELLIRLPLRLLFPQDVGLHLEVEEDGAAYAENAALKARAYARALGIPALADDSGLEVDLLDGRPGIRSARFSPLPNATDADRRVYLLSLLEGKPRPWHAHFHATVALALPFGDVYFTEGDCRGEIIPEERGTNGFGYDPIFLLSELGLTMAELSTQQKNRLSHRARAVKKAIPLIRRLG